MTRDDVALAARVGTLARELIAGPSVIDPVEETRAYLDYQREAFEHVIVDAAASVCVALRVPASPADPEIHSLIAYERDRYADTLRARRARRDD